MKKLGFIGKLVASLLASVMVFSSVLATNSQATVEASAAQSDFSIMAEGTLFNIQGYKILPGKYKIDDYINQINKKKKKINDINDNSVDLLDDDK